MFSYTLSHNLLRDPSKCHRGFLFDGKVDERMGMYKIWIGYSLKFLLTLRWKKNKSGGSNHIGDRICFPGYFLRYFADVIIFYMLFWWRRPSFKRFAAAISLLFVVYHTMTSFENSEFLISCFWGRPDISTNMYRYIAKSVSIYRHAI